MEPVTPNPLVDELSDYDKRRLSIQFAAMRRLFAALDTRTPDRTVTRLTTRRNRW